MNVILLYRYFSVCPFPHAAFLGYNFFMTGIIYCSAYQYNTAPILTSL